MYKIKIVLKYFIFNINRTLCDSVYSFKYECNLFKFNDSFFIFKSFSVFFMKNEF